MWTAVVAGLVAGLAVALEPWGHAVRPAGAVVLSVVALRGFWGLWREVRAGDSDRTRRAFREGTPAREVRSTARITARFVALTAVNPLTAVYFVALAAGLGDTVAGPARATAFVLAAFAASWAWQSGLALIGTGASRLPGAARTVTGVVGHVVVLIYAARLALA